MSLLDAHGKFIITIINIIVLKKNIEIRYSLFPFFKDNVIHYFFYIDFLLLLFIFFSAKTATIVLRGGSEQFIEESHRSIHDALMIVKVIIGIVFSY